MKRKLAILFVIIYAYAASVPAQGITLRISATSNQIERAAKNVPVTVTITNESKKVVNPQTLNGLVFEFSRCSSRKCAATNWFSTTTSIKASRLKKGESVTFDVDLANLTWGGNCCIQTFPLEPNLIVIPNDSRFLAATLTIASPAKRGQEISVRSNELEIEIIPKAFSYY